MVRQQVAIGIIDDIIEFQSKDHNLVGLELFDQDWLTSGLYYKSMMYNCNDSMIVWPVLSNYKLWSYERNYKG